MQASWKAAEAEHLQEADALRAEASQARSKMDSETMLLKLRFWNCKEDAAAVFATTSPEVFFGLETATCNCAVPKIRRTCTDKTGTLPPLFCLLAHLLPESRSSKCTVLYRSASPEPPKTRTLMDSPASKPAGPALLGQSGLRIFGTCNSREEDPIRTRWDNGGRTKCTWPSPNAIRFGRPVLVIALRRMNVSAATSDSRAQEQA